MSDTVAYFIMCGIGAFILLIEAHRQFSSPIKFHNQSGYRILDHIELEDLAARRIVLRGYLFYLGLYLLVYAILLTVVQLGDMVIGAGDKNGAQGDLAFEKVDTFFLDREGVARPIYIVVALIALLSTGWAKKIEHVMRGAAHRMAGIPSGIFKTITRLNRMDYALPDVEKHLVRTHNFLSLHKGEPNLKKEAKHILDGLRQIDFVAEAVVTPLRNTVFAQQDINAISALLKKQETNMIKLDELLADPNADRALLLSRIEEEKRNLQVLFSVLYFKDQDITAPLSHPPSAHVLQQLNRKPRDFVLNGLFFGAAALFVAALLIGFAIETYYASIQMELPVLAMPDSEYTYRAQKALTLTLQSMVIFWGVSVLAAMMRSVKVVEGRWPKYTFANVPYGRLTRLSLSAALVGVLIASMVLAVPDFIATLKLSGIGQFSSAAMGSLQTAMPDALRYGVAMMIVAATVVLVADRHHDLETRVTCMVTVVGTAVASLVMMMLFVADPNRSFAEAVRDLIIFAATSLAFLVSYALIVEKAEGQDGLADV